MCDHACHHHAEHLNHGEEDAVQMLKYMVHHNQHHIAELIDLSSSFGEDVNQLLKEAVDDFEEGNRKLERLLGSLGA